MKFRILTVTEYEKFKLAIPNPKRRFWLDPVGFPQDKHYPVVDDDGMKNRFGELPDNQTIGLRPVIEFDGEGASMEKGDKVELYGYKWTAVDEHILVCDEIIGDYKFADKTCLFKDSYLCYMLHQLMNERSDKGTAEQFLAAQKAKKASGLPAVSSEVFSIDEVYRKSQDWENGTFMGMASGVAVSALGLVYGGMGIGSFLADPGLGIIPKLAIAGVAIIAGAFLSIRSAIKHKKESRKKFITKLAKITDMTDEQAQLVAEGMEVFPTAAIKDEELKNSFAKINNLIARIRAAENRRINMKIDTFYIPETQKVYDVCMQFEADDIDSPQAREYNKMAKESLEKTIQLLIIEYDKSNEEKVQDISFDMGVKQKMLDQKDTEQSMSLTLK